MDLGGIWYSRVDQGGPWQTWVRHTSNGHLPHNTCTLGLSVPNRAAVVLVQIYLQSCCVGEARTELVAAQSVKTGPGRSLALLYIVRCTFPHRVLSTDCSRVFLMRDVKLSGSGSGNVIWFDSDATLDNHGLYPCRLC